MLYDLGIKVREKMGKKPNIESNKYFLLLNLNSQMVQKYLC